MELFLKITATFLLLVLSVHRVLVQDVPVTTDSPRRTINPDWLRKRLPSNVQAATSDSPVSYDQAAEESGVASGNDISEGVASGSFSFTEDQFSNETSVAAESQDAYVMTTMQSPTGDGNITAVDNSTAAPENFANISPNSTNNPNNTDVQATTTAPEKNVSAEDPGEQFSNGTETNATTNTDVVRQQENSTAPTSTAPPTSTALTSTALTSTALTSTAPTSTAPTSTAPTSTAPTSTAPTSTAPPTSPPQTASTSSTTASVETTTSAPVTESQADLSDKGAGTAERGYGEESDMQSRKSAWGAVLGTFVAVAVVALVVYVILKKKQQKAFSHSKLEEEFPSDPVLRLDNSDPLDLNFGRAAYYNPGLQGDNIQMSPFP
ncbi:uncharacterized protein [Eucyclogobius newberryi]|uniref:uncharacterized protein n=1 Tax=Eucyclogobius newberryi TaxID=166745 RepID=UPI003B59D004